MAHAQSAMQRLRQLAPALRVSNLRADVLDLTRLTATHVMKRRFVSRVSLNDHPPPRRDPRRRRGGLLVHDGEGRGGDRLAHSSSEAGSHGADTERSPGRLVKTTGDGFLAEFASPVEAVRCALSIQDSIAERGEANGGLKLRIGINLGDIIIEDDGDVFGDGVNVAARLEQMADPGGVLISGKIYEEIEGKIERRPAE